MNTYIDILVELFGITRHEAIAELLAEENDLDNAILNLSYSHKVIK